MPMRMDNPWAAAARGRVEGLPIRLALGLFLACGAANLIGPMLPAVWFTAMAAGQMLEAALGARLRRAISESRRTRAEAFFFVAALGNAIIFTAIAPITWFAGGEAAKLFALLIPAGGIVSVAIALNHGPRLLATMWAPHLTYLLGLPIADALLSPERDSTSALTIAAGGGLVAFQALLAASRIRHEHLSVQSALASAELERVRAEQASAAKTTFVATVSHEIRTPMNAVLGAAELLRRTDLTPAQRDHVDMLANASEILMGVLNDVLDLSKIESGKLEIRPEEIALVDKLQVAVGLWRPKAEEKGLTLMIDARDLPGRTMADPLRLQQIVFNLISNAVKFTERGSVRLSGGVERRSAGDTIWIEVTDTGCGMTAEAAERVFASFEQGSGGVNRTHGGTGLGLTISRRLAELMGGSLTVSSTAAVGSTFRLELPFAAAVQPPLPVGAPAAASAMAPGLEILVAEDHEVNRRLLRLILEPLGARVTQARDGKEAVALAYARPFDVILMDMQMPAMGGVEATSAIRRSDGPNVGTPILALSASVMDDHRAQWSSVGVDTILAKPIEVRALVNAICDATRQTRAVDECSALAG
jgi:two-component system, sensor histidine kinase